MSKHQELHTVGELINVLKFYPEEMEIVSADDFPVYVIARTNEDGKIIKLWID